MLDTSLIFDGTPPKTGVAITATAPSTNVIDMLVARDVGAGEADLEIHVQVMAAFTAAGAATLQVSFQGSADNATFYDMLLSPVIPKASLVVGAKVFRYEWPRDQLLNPTNTPFRYYRLNYVVATGPFTAGSVFSFVTGLGDRQDFIAYPNNYNVGA